MPQEQRVSANGIELAYDAFGQAGDPPVLLIMGLNTQMIAWPESLCEDLAGRGFHVVRFDNRDCGRSQHLDHLPVPTLREIALRRKRPPYRIVDMADDAAGLVDALALGPCHVVGASMGGYIAQSLALRRPDLVRSLVPIMTSTGSRLVGQPKPKVLAALARRVPVRDRDMAGEAAVRTFQMIGSPGFEFDREHYLEIGGLSWDRGYSRGGYLRQLAAINAQPDRTKRLRGLTVPTTVIHGLADPLVAASGGLAIAKAIPGARFVGFAGMGHDLPRPLLGDLADEIAATARRAEALAQAA